MAAVAWDGPGPAPAPARHAGAPAGGGADADRPGRRRRADHAGRRRQPGARVRHRRRRQPDSLSLEDRRSEGRRRHVVRVCRSAWPRASVSTGWPCSARLFLVLALWIIEGFEPQTRVLELSVKLGETTAAAAAAHRGRAAPLQAQTTSCAVSRKRKCRISSRRRCEPAHRPRLQCPDRTGGQRQGRGRVERTARRPRAK